MAVGWQVYDLTRRPLDLGLVGLAQFIPALLLVLVVGLVADRYPRQRIAALSQGTGLLICLALALLSGLGLIRETLIFALVFAIGASRAFESPTMEAEGGPGGGQIADSHFFHRAIGSPAGRGHGGRGGGGKGVLGGHDGQSG